MSLTSLLNRPCTLIHRSLSGSRDEFGNDIPTETTETTVYELQQTQRTEATGSELGIETFLGVFPAGTNISVYTAVADGVDGREYEVIGEPWAARNPRTGAQSHVEATLRRAASEGAGS